MPKDINSPSYAASTLSILPTVAFNTPMSIPMQADHSIIFIHIPQTGGTNLNYLVSAKAWVAPEAKTKSLFKSYRFALPTREDKISPKKMTDGWKGGLYTARKILDKNPDFCEDIDFLQSHFPFGIHEFIKTRKTAYVTLVRDPIERELSALNISRQKKYDISETPEKYLMECLDNPQTRLLAGYDAMKEKCTEKTLEKAKQNINTHFLLAGITEDTNGFIQIFASMQKWGPIALCRAQVTGKKKIETPSPELKKMLEEKHQLDIQLYAWVKKRWYEWKQKFVQEEPQAIPKHQPIFSLLPNYSEKRVPEFLLKKEIQAYNQSVSDELVKVMQNPSGLSSITAGQANEILEILNEYIPQVKGNYEEPAQLVLSYLFQPEEIIGQIGAMPLLDASKKISRTGC